MARHVDRLLLQHGIFHRFGGGPHDLTEQLAITDSTMRLPQRLCFQSSTY
jgi:hypothetical protein